MDKKEARALLHEHLELFRARKYHDLVKLIKNCCEHTEIHGASGTWYQIAVVVYWDDKPHGALRVIGSIDDGGWRALMPLSEDFILAPDGTFVGE